VTTSQQTQAALQPFWDATGTSPVPDVPIVSGRDAEVAAEHSAFRVSTCANASVAAVNAAVAEFAGREVEPIDPSLCLASYTTHVTVDGTAPPKWASLSGLYETGDDRHIQLHCNFPHHGAGVARRLGVAEDREAFESAIRTWGAVELETQLIEDAMIAAACRTLDEWDAHPHAISTSALPIASITSLTDDSGAAARNRSGTNRGPLSGLRVLDCSRVLAGPVAGHTLANLGADVLRVGAAHLPHVEVCVIATGAGKRNTDIDLRQPSGRETFARLLKDVDVVIDAFRPGALDQFGFGAQDIAAIAPAASVVQICAFDWVGPWAGRRGFDSIVQTTTGIRMVGMEMAGTNVPTPLPVQALDYATGYFGAAAAIRAAHQSRNGGGSSLSRLSLLRTRNWLVGLGDPAPFTPGAITPEASQLATIAGDMGNVEMVRPVTGRWHHGPRNLGTSDPTWA